MMQETPKRLVWTSCCVICLRFYSSRHNEKEASKLLLWQPDRGRANRGRRRM